MRVAHAVGNVQARILMVLFYAVIVTPFALGARLFSDPLGLRRRPRGWLAREARVSSIDEGRRQF